MHEMALAESIVDLVREQAGRDAFARVRTIRLSIGVLSHVEPRALEFGFDVVAKGTVAQGARLAIDRPTGTGWCIDCNEAIDVAARGAECPRCGGHKWMLTGGDEMRVVELEVD
jgi:hydrogenase nickel incorporation protein HypA/HybF